MALATQCPHCKTTFRVAQDQLKLRAGLVRCGSCKEIFNGIEHLLAADAAAQPVATAERAQPVDQQENTLPVPQAEPMSDAESIPTPASATLDFAYPEPEPEHPEADPIASVDFMEEPGQAVDTPGDAPNAHDTDDNAQEEDPSLQHMTPDAAPTTADVPDSEQPEPVDGADAPDALDQVIEEVRHKPVRGKKKSALSLRRAKSAIPTESLAPAIPEPEEPDFLKQGRRRQKLGHMLRAAMQLASLILLLGVFGQASYLFRDQIAAHFPETKPALLSACSFMHCSLGLPTQIETLSIESDALETLDANKNDSVLTMLLRNVSTTVQAWPYIELTLNDANGTMLARRVFVPHEYLPPTQEVAKGLASNSEQAIKLYVEFSGAKPAGYHVGLFYP